MSAEYGPGNARGRQEALQAIFSMVDARFNELFLAGKDHAEKDVDAAFVFYYSPSTNQILELNEQVEPVFTGYRIRRELMPRGDVEVVDGLYRSMFRESYKWCPDQGLESFTSSKAVYNQAPRWLIDLAQSLTDVEMPDQTDELHDPLKEIAGINKLLNCDLVLIHADKIYNPQAA
jgi:hypothetical protein